jgi:hypothetical protein
MRCTHKYKNISVLKDIKNGGNRCMCPSIKTINHKVVRTSNWVLLHINDTEREREN